MASSREEQRQLNIPTGSSLQEEAVNPQGLEEVLSSSPAQTNEMTREVRYDHLMERVVERNKGAAGVDGMAWKSLRSYLLDNWTRICDELLTGSY